jgi:hypothetical protein
LTSRTIAFSDIRDDNIVHQVDRRRTDPMQAAAWRAQWMALPPSG